MYFSLSSFAGYCNQCLESINSQRLWWEVLLSHTPLWLPKLCHRATPPPPRLCLLSFLMREGKPSVLGTHGWLTVPRLEPRSLWHKSGEVHCHRHILAFLAVVFTVWWRQDGVHLGTANPLCEYVAIHMLILACSFFSVSLGLLKTHSAEA